MDRFGISLFVSFCIGIVVPLAAHFVFLAHGIELVSGHILLGAVVCVMLASFLFFAGICAIVDSRTSTERSQTSCFKKTVSDSYRYVFPRLPADL